MLSENLIGAQYERHNTDSKNVDEVRAMDINIDRKGSRSIIRLSI